MKLELEGGEAHIIVECGSDARALQILQLLAEHWYVSLCDRSGGKATGYDSARSVRVLYTPTASAESKIDQLKFVQKYIDNNSPDKPGKANVTYTRYN